MWRNSRILLGIVAISLLWNCSKEKNTENSAPIGDNVAKRDSVVSQVIKGKNLKYKKFEGAWFTIEYPESFTVKRSQKSSTFQGNYDSAIFTSPDGKVEFYVFSPQWNGKPKDILIDRTSETKIDSTIEKNTKFTIKCWVIEANNGSYHRAYEETIDNVSHTNKIFGITYNPDNYKDEYQEEYLHFKKSLVQYAD